MPKRFGRRHRVLEKIVRKYEGPPASGNNTDEMLRRTEYMLALQMLAKRDDEDARILTTALQLYAKRFSEDAVAVIVYLHNAKGFLAYEIEVIDADGTTITVDTVGHAWLLSLLMFESYTNLQLWGDDAKANK